MSRSLKKPPFVHYKLQKRVDVAQAGGKNSVIKTNYELIIPVIFLFLLYLIGTI